MKTKLISLLLISVCTFTACKDDEGDDTPATPTQNNNNNNQNSDPTISFSDADGSLIAIKSSTSTPIGNIPLGTAVGAFYDGGNLTDVGTVSVEGVDLTKNSNNSYTATASASNPSGISYSLPIEWSVSGANGFSAFTENNMQDFPAVAEVNSGGTVDKSDGYTLSTTSISNSDSVVFTVGNVAKIVSANTTSYTFSSQELSSLSNGSNIVSIAPYNFYSKTISSKKIYFVNESVVQKSVTIQD